MDTQNMALLITGMASAIITLVVLILYNNMKQSRYDKEKNMVMLETMRDSFEKQIYLISDKLTRSEERWRDVNHLLIRNEYLNNDNIIRSDNTRKVFLNDFLKSNGIAEKDLIQEKNLVFVLTPFHSEFRADYSVIKNTCQSVGFKCIRGDETFLQGEIFSEMLRLILKSSLIIANINGRNPNVLYELGIAQALDKPVILVSKQPEHLPIDIRSRRFLIYKGFPDLEIQLKDELIKVLSRI